MSKLEIVVIVVILTVLFVGSYKLFSAGPQAFGEHVAEKIQ